MAPVKTSLYQGTKNPIGLALNLTPSTTANMCDPKLHSSVFTTANTGGFWLCSLKSLNICSFFLVYGMKRSCYEEMQHFKISEFYDDKYHLAITRKPVITTNCIEYKQTIDVLESNDDILDENLLNLFLTKMWF